MTTNFRNYLKKAISLSKEMGENADWSSFFREWREKLNEFDEYDRKNRTSHNLPRDYAGMF